MLLQLCQKVGFSFEQFSKLTVFPGTWDMLFCLMNYDLYGISPIRLRATGWVLVSFKTDITFPSITRQAKYTGHFYSV